MEERRRHKRHELKDRFEVLDQDTGESIGHLINISSQGILMIGKPGFEVGQNLQLIILLTKKLLGKKTLYIDSRCAWVKPDTDPEYHLYGLEFVDVPPEEIGLIAILIVEQGKPE